MHLALEGKKDCQAFNLISYKNEPVDILHICAFNSFQQRGNRRKEKEECREGKIQEQLPVSTQKSPTCNTRNSITDWNSSW